MNKKSVGNILLVIGIVILIFSLLVDVIGIGKDSAFGFYQIIGAVVGIVVAGIGWFLKNKK